MKKQMKEYTREEVSKHNTREDLWIIIDNKVHDVTKFIKKHPGGSHIIVDRAGEDVTTVFKKMAGHNINPKMGKIMEKLEIGRIV